MSAYLVCLVRIDDPATYRKYTAVETLEGPPFDGRLVVLEVPSLQAVKTFHASPEYQAVMKFRHASSESRFLLADGVPEGLAAPDDRVVKSE